MWSLIGMIDFGNLIGLLNDGLHLVFADSHSPTGYKIVHVERVVFQEAKRFINRA